MIGGTYAISGTLILATLPLLLHHSLTAETQTLIWAVTFFFASAAASAGYLTVSEVFPLEMRALAIALFYALGTCIGGLERGPLRPAARRGLGTAGGGIWFRSGVDAGGRSGRIVAGRR